MLDISNLDKYASKTVVKASDCIFEELGKNTYDYKDVISELIDNALAARHDNGILKVDISIYVDSNNNPLEFVIKDNAEGIGQDQLGPAITPAGTRTQDSLNEHGLGMKQAVSALGELKYLATKTKDEDWDRVILQFKFGELETYQSRSKYESGTEIAIHNLKPIVVANAASYSRSIIPYLGARYRRFLKPDNPMLELSIHIIEKHTDKELYSYMAEEVKPIYFHPSTRKNAPVILKYRIKGENWRALLTFGYSPQQDEEYDELGIGKPNKFHPYNVTLSKQGLDIMLCTSSDNPDI